MELTQDKINLIDKIIKNDRKYPNNEDLYDDFFNETCKRSVVILNSIDAEATLETYLKRVVTTSIINVLKDSGRLRRTRSGYMSTKEVLVDNKTSIDYSEISVDYSSVSIPQTPEDIVIQKQVLEFVADTVIKLDREEPDKDYLNIYTLRYDKGMTQKEISEELGISQSEVSKRLFKLMDKVKNIIE
ncbi:sigma-70 family RNA polymerase sigma factor [bacterium]|nr:sigma-70 family RNA polymerase sigma factor [bacterium]